MRKIQRSQMSSLASAPRAGVESLEPRTLFAANFVWDGGGANANWTTAANWADDVAPPTDGSATLEFPVTAAQKTNTNNFPAGTKFARILFSGSGYAISGNAITLLDNVNALEGAGSNRFELDTKVAAGQSSSWGYIANGLARLNVHGDVDTGGNLLSFSGTGITRVYGDISGSGGIRKFGAGDVLLLGSNSYTGTTTVSEGNLYLNNTSAAGTSGPVVATGGVLRGTGKVGDVTIGDTAKFIPGQTAFSTTVMTTGNLSVASGGAVYFNLNGATPGTLYDQLQVKGTVTLDAGSLLSLTLGDDVGPGSSFTLIANDGNDPVGGTFQAMAEGTKFSQGGVTFQISYVGGDGNDIVLTSVAANNPPVNSVPNTQSTPQDTSLVFSDEQGNAISLADPDAGSADVKVTLTVTNGALTLESTDGLTFSVGEGNSDPTMTFTGSLDSVNAALQGLTYAPAGGFTGDSQLTITTDDQGNTGPGGPQSDTDNLRIIVTDQDQTAISPTAGNVAAAREIGQTATIDALAAASDSMGRPLTLEVAQAPASGTAEVDDAGTPSDPSDDFITYTANAGFNGDDSFTYRVSTGQGTTATGTITVTTNAGVAIDQDPDDPSKTALFIVGTDASEQIKIAKKKTQLRVLINKVQQNDLLAMPTGSLVVIAKGGDDSVKAGPLKKLAQRLYGGDGNDTLAGGKAGDVIIGGAGSDKIKGGGGNDLLIAGDGADNVSGAAGDDVIASGGGGITTYTASNVAAIRDLMNAWTAAGTDYAAKLKAITVTGVGTGATKTTLGTSTLSDDTGIDTINGSSGNDVFFVNASGGSAVDKLKKTAAETAVEL